MGDPYMKLHDYPNRIIKKLDQLKEENNFDHKQLADHLGLNLFDIDLVYKHHRKKSWEKMRPDKYRNVRNALFRPTNYFLRP